MSGGNMLRFNSQLMLYLQMGMNDLVKKLLKRDYYEIKDILGYLLHYAADCNNAETIRHLIELGADVDLQDSESKTALMIAVEKNYVKIVESLLEADANIDVIANADGKSVLGMIFDSEHVVFSREILTSILQRLRRDSSSINEFVDKLIKFGCSMYHATFTRDIDVMKSLLERGIPIDSRGYCNWTAVHGAAALGDVDTIKWLIANNADVNSLDEGNRSPLFFAAARGKVDAIRLLLEHGANPNITEKHYDYTPLFVVFVGAFDHDDRNDDRERFNACIELLLQYDAVPQNSRVDERTLFDYALYNENPRAADLLIARLAMFDRLGTVKNGMSVVVCNDEEHRRAQRNLELNYKLCWELLGSKVHRELTFVDLLNENDMTMRIHVRDETLVSKIKLLDSQLGKTYPFYFELLLTRVSKALEVVKLENAAISVLCRLFDHADSYNLCYHFGRKVVGYLNERDLVQLCRVTDLNA